MTSPGDYWAERFTVGVEHHSRQNHQISRDFLSALPRSPVLERALAAARTIVEVGCGTGELTNALRLRQRRSVLIGTDLSKAAVLAARQLHPFCQFARFDLLHDDPAELGLFELCVCSNVLEHFRDPHAAIDRLFQLAPTLLILVPYRQPTLDSYTAEGGAGHVHQFELGSFDRYRVIDWLVFQTEGWQHGGAAENPRQLAVLLRRRPARGR